MERTQVPSGSKPDQETLYRHIFDNAQGTVLVGLDTEPTTASGILEVNQWAYFSNFIYININGSVYKIAATLT